MRKGPSEAAALSAEQEAKILGIEDKINNEVVKPAEQPRKESVKAPMNNMKRK